MNSLNYPELNRDAPYRVLDSRAQHGDDRWRYPHRVQADFSSNVSYLGVDAGLLRTLERALSGIARYPQPWGEDVLPRLAVHHALNPEQVLLCNGATDAIWLLARALPQAEVAIFQPSFSEYEVAFARHGHRLKHWFMPNAGTLYCRDADILILGRPNNPDGSLFAVPCLLDWLKAHPSATVIVDESFIELSDGVSMASHLADHEGLIVIRSLTKTAALAGLRLGYILTHPVRMEQLRSYQHHWAVNALALAALRYLLEHDAISACADWLPPSVAMRARVARLPGCQVHPSHTPYFLLQQDWMPASKLKQHLLQQYGILIRDASNFYGLDQRHIRLSLQAEPALSLLYSALEEVARDHA